MSDDAVAMLRHFNRTFTPRIGVLDESYLGTGLPLAAARTLFEIGLGPVSVHELRRRLDADSGYVSRLLRRLEEDDLISLQHDPTDRRRRVVTLTASGRRAWGELDRRADEIAARVLQPLSDEQQRDLTAALERAQRLLRLASVRLLDVAPNSDAAIVAMRAYVAELDRTFPENFDVGSGFDDDELAQMAAPDGGFVVLDDDGEPLGCGGVRRVDDATCEIKRMWLHPSVRGLGLGRRLLERLEQLGRGLGHDVVVLDTHTLLESAIALYESAGYTRIDRYNDNPYAKLFFRKELVG